MTTQPRSSFGTRDDGPTAQRIAVLQTELEETYRSVTQLTNELEREKERVQLLTGIPHLEPSQPVECDSKPLDVQFAFE